MKLSELKEGTPVRIQAFKDGKNINDIWGKIRKNSKNQCQIVIYYYEGGNINLNSPEYEIHATAYENGEHKIDWNNQKVGGQEDDRLVENRDTFRIYIGIPVECTVKDEDTAALLVDLSEGGFRICLRDEVIYSPACPVEIAIEDGDFSFTIGGRIVWNKKVDSVKTMYGCAINSDQNKESVITYIKEKQKKLYDEITSGIK